VFQVYEELDLGNAAPVAFWSDHKQSASTLELEAMVIGADSGEYRPADDLDGKSPRNDCTAWLRWFENQIERAYEASGGDLEIIADVLEKDFGTLGNFEYATPVSTQVDVLGDWHFASRDHRKHLMLYLEQLATRMGLRCPEMIASAAVLVIERTIEWARASGESDAAQTARLLFQCLRSAYRVD